MGPKSGLCPIFMRTKTTKIGPMSDILCGLNCLVGTDVLVLCNLTAVGRVGSFGVKRARIPIRLQDFRSHVLARELILGALLIKIQQGL